MKTRKGWLVKRGRIFYATWEVAGKRFQKTTGTGDRREATQRLAEIMRPYLVEDEARTLESVKARIEGAKAELAAIDAERNPPLTVAASWNAYERAGNRREIGDLTMANYHGYWKAFTGPALGPALWRHWGQPLTIDILGLGWSGTWVVSKDPADNILKITVKAMQSA